MVLCALAYRGAKLTSQKLDQMANLLSIFLLTVPVDDGYSVLISSDEDLNDLVFYVFTSNITEVFVRGF